MRYTKSEVHGMFKRLLKAIGKQQGPILINDNADGVDHFPGGWILAHNSTYGGYVIEQEEESGGVSHPLGSMRRSAREMYLSMLMAAQALEDIRYRQEQLNKHEVV